MSNINTENLRLWILSDECFHDECRVLAEINHNQVTDDTARLTITMLLEDCPSTKNIGIDISDVDWQGVADTINEL